MKKRLVVAMSGGVDSSVAAFLLVEQGYEVIGISMKLGGSDCCGIDDARGVAQRLGIPFYAINYEKEFEDKVIKYFYEEYRNGRTPNPCIICNREIKFKSLLNKAKALGGDYIATGHYARIVCENKMWLIKKGKDKEKDQSYVLFHLLQEQLSHILFPLGDYTKDKVRQLAKELGLKVHNKPASYEICFILDNDYRKFIKKYIKPQPGPIVDSSGKQLGEHQGIAFYTIGQRKDIGSYGMPYYVIKINKETNTIIIGNEQELYKDVVIAENVNWIGEKGYEKPIKAKIRYRHKESPAIVYPLPNNRAKIKFKEPQRAITPGQAIVFYDNDVVLGGGWICEE